MRVIRILTVVLLPLLASCAQRAHVEERSGLDACCVDAETSPRWLVGMVEPAAPLVGRILGNIAWRRGHLDGTDASEVVGRRLRPLDIVLEASLGRLTGHTIPGLFTHTAIYVGGERDLRALGVWNDPLLAPHHAAIRAGARFIEADHRGVHLSDPRTVFDADHMVIIRPSVATANWRRRAVLTLFDRLGDRFDFHFDASTRNAVFCVELVCEAIPELRLPRQILYGRPTIIPDTVAAELLRGNPRLSFVLYAKGYPGGYDLESRQQLASDLALEWSGKRSSANRSKAPAMAGAR